MCFLKMIFFYFDALFHRFEASLKDCLIRIQAYNELLSKVDSARSIKYDSKEEGHEKLLLEVKEKIK